MKPPISSTPGQRAGRGPAAQPDTFARPTPKVSRAKTAKVLTAAEKAAFLASRPDLQKK
jgi:hypothetical protein